MPEARTAERVDFPKPVKNPDTTGVEEDPATTVRFGYKKVPAGSGCLHVPVEELPADVLAYFLGLAAEKEKSNGS